MKIALAGPGAFGQKHLDALAKIEGIEVVSLCGGEGDASSTAEVAKVRNFPHWTTNLAESLAQPGVEAAILATPTPLHAEQAMQCLRAGKHVMVEIPMAESLADAERLLAVQRETGLVAMAGHTRRFNPSHQWVRRKILAGELKIQQMDVQTYFFRRSNLNALGQPRTWTDHLLWHHACHTVDLFQYQTGEVATQVQALQGPIHPKLGIAMDMSIGLKVPSEAICTLSLSFNNDGPFGTFFRYICDNGTYIARYDDLYDGKESKIDVSKVDAPPPCPPPRLGEGTAGGIELQDREFFAAIRERREPNASFQQVIGAMRTLNRLERCLADVS